VRPAWMQIRSGPPLRQVRFRFKCSKMSREVVHKEGGRPCPPRKWAGNPPRSARGALGPEPYNPGMRVVRIFTRTRGIGDRGPRGAMAEADRPCRRLRVRIHFFRETPKATSRISQRSPAPADFPPRHLELEASDGHRTCASGDLIFARSAGQGQSRVAARRARFVHVAVREDFDVSGWPSRTLEMKTLRLDSSPRPGLLATRHRADLAARLAHPRPFSAGGASDTYTASGPEDHRADGQDLVVENRTGAGAGSPGSAAKSAPDGTTAALIDALSYAPGCTTSCPGRRGRLDSRAMIAQTLSHRRQRRVEAGELAALIAEARARPGKLNFGSAGWAAHPRRERALQCERARESHAHPYKGMSDARCAAGGEMTSSSLLRRRRWRPSGRQARGLA